MSQFTQIRQQYPQYSDMDDGELAYRLWKAQGEGQPMGVWADSSGLDDSQFGKMIGHAKKQGYEPTASVGGPKIETGEGLIRSGLQGLTLGGGDELVAGMTAGARKLGGDPRAVKDIYSQEVEAEKAKLESFRKESPILSGIAEFTGGVAAPLGVARTLKGATALGGGTGLVAGYLSAEGEQRGEAALTGGLFGALVSPAMMKGGQLLGSSFDELLQMRAKEAAAKGSPSIAQLRKASNEAYKKARESGVVIDSDEYQKFVRATLARVTDGGTLEPGLLPKSEKVLRALDRKVGKAVGIEEMDNLRKLAQIPAGEVTNKAEQRAARHIIDNIDTFVESLTPEQLSAGVADDVAKTFASARSLWAKVRKTENIQDILDLAESGSYAGGAESAFKNQLQSILRNKRKRRGYTKDELKLMADITRGTPIGNLVGSISHLGFSTTGGRNILSPAAGLSASAVGGFAVGGPAGAVAAPLLEVSATTALRRVREMNMTKQVEVLRDLIASGKAAQFREHAPAAYKLLSAVAQKLGQGTIVTTVPDLQRTQ